MTEARVEVLDEDGRVAKVHRIVINGPGATFDVKTDPIEAQLFRTLDEWMLDLLGIAGVVFAADGMERRGGPTRPGFGADWHRSFHYRIALRRPDLWEREDMKAALTDAVSFLTDDAVRFTFTQGNFAPAAHQDFLNLHPDAPGGFHADEIILFSGGLDSLAGAIEALCTTDRRVVLVTHRSAQKMIPHQERLAHALRDKFRGRVLHLPIMARRHRGEARVSTQRSRSFLFAALGHVIANLFGASTISFYENGVVSHNLPISPQVIGSMATRTTHPLSLRKLEACLSCIHPEKPARIENHFAWLTKTDVIEKIARFGFSDLIRHAVSCTHVRDQTTLHTHCGSCSQCLDRRFAILASGLSAHDPAEQYLTDVLLGARDHGRHRTMALDWTRHMLQLTAIDPTTFLEQFAGELARIAEGARRQPPANILQMVHDLHQRQGRAVKSVLEVALREHGHAILDRTLPATSLLRMVLAERAGEVAIPEEIVEPHPPFLAPASTGVQADLPPPGILPLRVQAWQENELFWISVAGLTRISGNGARVVHALMPTHAADKAAQFPVDRCRYTKAGHLGQAMAVGKSTVTRAVKLCRDALGAAWEAVEGEPPPAPLLIQNRLQHGYRLDPEAAIASPTGHGG